jgi:CHAD domain-containing protein
VTTWRFEPAAGLSSAFRRAALEEIAGVRDILCSGGGDWNEAVHSARQSFKRLRALTRLAKPQLGADFDTENRRWRDAGRLLSSSRETTVLLQTFDKLIADCGGEVSADGVAQLRARLTKTRQTNGATYNSGRAEDILRLLDDAEIAISKLRWPNSARTLVRGLALGQRRLRRKWKKAYRTNEAVALHSWRKCMKDQAAQLRLFRVVLNKAMRDRRSDEKDTAELLGDEHDLWLLHERLCEMTLPQGLAGTRDFLSREIAAHRDKLRREAFGKGEAFSAEKPKVFADAVGDAWAKATKRKPKKRRSNPRRAGGRERSAATSPTP